MKKHTFAVRWGSLTWLIATVVGAGLVLATLPVYAQEKEESKDEKYKGFQEIKVEKYGYKMWIPEEFKIQEKIDKTTSWIYQPGAAETKVEEKAPKKGGLAGKLMKGIGVDVSSEKAASSSSSSGGLESALTIYVNWVWMPDVSSQTMYETNLKSVKDNIASPDPDYRDIQFFDKKKGYDWEGLAFWYKEVDKEKPDEIHRWHIQAYGNKSSYIVGLCGTYEQFQKWGPLYEKAIKSWELIPLKEKE